LGRKETHYFNIFFASRAAPPPRQSGAARK
jgi:hypothetical protein